MADFSHFVPAHIRRLAAGESKPLKRPPSGAEPIALNLNENPFGPSPLARKAMQSELFETHRYPEINATQLHEQIARFHRVPAEQVLVTAGATELLCMIARAALGPGRDAITSEKSFIVYKLATQLSEGRLIEVPAVNGGYDLGVIAKAIDRNTRIVFIANPNNPTGTLVSADELDELADRLPEHVLLVLDEAYGDYAAYFARQRRVCYSRAFEYVRQGRNVIVLKTFSKVHGLAGLRVGYGIGPAKLISLLAPLRTIFSVSSLAQAAAAAALDDAEHIGKAIENNAEQTAILTLGLEKIGITVPQTWANFLYCELRQDASRFADRLRECGVLVQPLELWAAPTAIRVSVGTPDENQRFLEAFAKCWA
jgi:histidinol-phosphate aminotransferase